MNVASCRFFLRLLVLVSICAVGPLRAAETQPPRTVVFFGDSLTAGYGLDDPDEDAYPALIRQKIDAENLTRKRQ